MNRTLYVILMVILVLTSAGVIVARIYMAVNHIPSNPGDDRLILLVFVAVAIITISGLSINRRS